MNQSNKQKKDYLNKYKWLKHRARSLELEIEAIRSQYTGHAITYSDMPSSPSAISDLSDYMARVSDLVDNLVRIRKDMVDAYEQISDSIEQMQDDQEKELLRLRYLVGYKWEEVADQMHYTDRWVRILHGRALEHFHNSSF